MSKGIFIMSLNSKRLSEAIANKDHLAFVDGVSSLDVFVFDTFEILNGIFFNDQSVEKEKAKIEHIIAAVEREFIPFGDQGRSLIRSSEHREILKPYIHVLYSEYYTNDKFERHCKNQIFQNLQPKLRKVNVEENNDRVIELLVPFLLVEIALFLYVYNSTTYRKIFGMEKEMNIVSAIRERKYKAFEKYLVHDVEYMKLNVEESC